MFSQKEFIDVSRKFVCVRLESYESKEHQDLVRKFLDGRFANTAFVILAPDGETQLSRTGRGPNQALGDRGHHHTDDENVIEKLEGYSAEYELKGNPAKMVLQDFHTFRQALNVASADQRLLVYAVGTDSETKRLRNELAPVFSDENIIGLFHLDFSNPKSDKEWIKSIRKASGEDGIYVIRADEFGQSGEVLERLELSSSPESIRGTLLAANLAFSLLEERKDYSSHVSEGRREGIHFENAMPYGEDRDGDGVIDHRGGDRRGGDGRGSKGKGKSTGSKAKIRL